MKRRRHQRINLLTAMSLGIGLWSASSAQALQIQATVTDQGGFFHYDVRVLNDDPIAELLAVSIDDAPTGDALIDGSLSAPAGFLASYDTGVGIVDLLADAAGFFPDGSTGLFSFDSLASPLTAFTRYQTLDLNGDVLVGQLDSQLVQAVSAPATLALMVFGLGVWSFRDRVGCRDPISLNHYALNQELS